MVYFSDLNSIIECIYLGDSLEEKIGSCNVFVNPENISYIIGKIVIINKVEYPIENIKTLINNNCEVISRVHINLENEHLLFQPYILCPNFNIMWNGDTVNYVSEIIKNCSFIKEKKLLLFPKVKVKSFRVDEQNNLTAIGWALQQVGINIKEDTPFIHLDMLKTKKMQL